MSPPRNEDFLFAQEAQRLGYVNEEQIEEAFLLQKRMSDELRLDERISIILVKREWLAEEQAKRVHAKLEPTGATNEIEGYTLLERIGAGAMGTVYKAMHRGLQRLVAIKVLRPDLGKDDTQVERLKEEAKLLASLDHPNIVRALDAGESNGFPFFVMEYVEGETLKDKIAREGAMDEDEALRVARDLADALERARRMGVVHRDVKPGNVILNRRGEPKLMDLGLAKGPVDLGLTQHGATVGTPQYISPEQAEDPRRADTRSDIYSLGATLYAMVTGRPPFSGRTLAEMITKVLYTAPTPPRVLNRKISAEVGYLIERMMLKDPALRYRTPAEVVNAIESVRSGRSIIPSGFTGNWEAFLLRQRFKRIGKIAALVLGVAVLAGGGFLWWKSVRTHREEVRVADLRMQQVLRTTSVEDVTDDERSLLTKYARASEALASLRQVDGLAGLGALETQVDDLSTQLDAFRELRGLEDQLERWTSGHEYQKAFDALEAFIERVPGQRTPVARAAARQRDRVSRESGLSLMRLRSETLKRTGATLADAEKIHRNYVAALDRGLLESGEVIDARKEGAVAHEILVSLRRELAALAADFGPLALRAALSNDRLDLQAVAKSFDQRREALIEPAENAWKPVQAGGWIEWQNIRPLVEARLEAIEDALVETVGAAGDRVIQEADVLWQGGHREEALTLLERLREAARHGGFRELRARAAERHANQLEAWEAARADAGNALRMAQRDIRALLRRGDAAGIRRRVSEILAEHDETTWPVYQQVAELADMADALELLERKAVIAAGGKRLENVRLRSGAVVPRWNVDEIDADGGRLFVSPRAHSQPEWVDIGTVDPDQVLEWASAFGKLDPLLRGVGELAGLEELESPDLRGRLERLRRIDQAFTEAGRTTGLAAWARDRLREGEKEQERREKLVREALTTLQAHTGRRNWEMASWVLEVQFGETSQLQFSDAYQDNLELIDSYRRIVEGQLANAELSKTYFPAADIQVDGDRTIIALDMENEAQLDVFRVNPSARALGVLEGWTTDGVTTPGETNSRLHLLRGMEGLHRDHPLAIPCPFDPAHRIEVAFDWHTLSHPFLLVVEIDGLKVGILSADPTSPIYAELWRYPGDVPPIDRGETPPEVNWYGRGRGVAFQGKLGYGDIRRWDWPVAGYGRRMDEWERRRELPGDLFAFRPGRVYRVRVVREGGRMTLFASEKGTPPAERASEERAAWAERGATSDVDRHIRGGSGLIRILTWTPQAIDNLEMSGVVLEKFQ